jgi:predicted ATPase/DNA-binding NarL/FixJ family response regulator
VNLSSFIGRGREVAAACTLLARSEVRLLTLTGTGGVGKTRLALAIAVRIQEEFQEGVCFVSLASIADAALVLPTLVLALGLPTPDTTAPLEYLQAALRERHLLVLLDNFERVVEAAPHLVDLLAACPRLKLLLTSRERLHVRGEHEFLVQPLALPDAKYLPERETLERYGAVALFLERAREVQPTFLLNDEQAPLVVEICRRLDGLPLAIELAVARLKLFPLRSLLERLEEHRLQLLTGGPRDLPERQHTLRDTIVWSYNLLSADEQRLFRLLSVFTGGWTLEAVEQVHGAPGDQSALVLDGMTSLLDKHLVYQERLEGDEPRFGMLETIREYGLEALTACGELEGVRQAHAHHCLALAEQADAHRFAQGQERWFEQLKQEHDNLRAALQWLVEREEDGQCRAIAWRLVGVLYDFWVVYGYVREGQQFVERILVKNEGVVAPVRAKALNSAGWLALWQNAYERAEALCQESLALYRTLQDTFGMAEALYRLGLAVAMRGDATVACALLEECQVLFREAGHKTALSLSLMALASTIIRQADQSQYPRAHLLLEEGLALSREEHFQPGSAWTLYCLGLWHLQQDDASAARPFFAESLALFRTLGQRHYIVLPLYYLGKVAAAQRDFPTAYALYKETLVLLQQLDDLYSSATCLEGWGCAAAQHGAAVWAVQLWGAAEVRRKASDSSAFFTHFTMLDEHADYERVRAAVSAQLGEQTFAQALAVGRAMTLEQVLSSREDTISSGQPPTKSMTGTTADRQKGLPSTAPNELTMREVEVLHLVAQGLTDAQIAEALVISPRTVNAHLRSIYTKLDITSRNAATYFAIEHGLV